MPLRSMKNIALKEIKVESEKLVFGSHTSGVSVKTRVNLAKADF